jgi:diguanylate cyclase
MTLAAENLPPETAAEYLRLALPLMSQHRVPATPQNYAVWYGYVSGDKPELKAAIDRHLDAGEKFTAAVSEQLYREYIAEHDIAKVERVRKDLNAILMDVLASLNEAGHEANAFGDRIDGLVDRADHNPELSDIRNLLSALIEETRGMRAATDQMHSNFESKSKEIEELQQQLQRERQRAITDPLTGLFNRAALVDQLTAAVEEETGDTDVPAALIMIDIDHFKSINDNHGHLIGDRVIRFVAQVLQKNIKGKDCAARYGGEEFTVLLPETPAAGAVAVAETIRKAIAQAQLVRADNKAPLGQITVSAGVTSYQHGEDIMDFLNRADEAMYKSKREGRNRVSAL